MQSLAPDHLSHPILALVVFSFLAVIVVPPAAHAQDGGSSLETAVANLEWRNIGPTIMGGRVADLAVEYAWRSKDDYSALLFVAAETSH